MDSAFALWGALSYHVASQATWRGHMEGPRGDHVGEGALRLRGGELRNSDLWPCWS